MILRLLLRLYPPAFRERFGREALGVLRADLRDARRRGRIRGSLVRLRLLTAFAADGVLARLDGVRGGLGGLWTGWGQDLKLAVRSSLRRPAFALVSIASLAIGVGANATMFSVMDTLFLREIPGTERPDRIVEVGATWQGDLRFEPWSYPDFLDLRAEAPVDQAVLVAGGPVGLTDDGGGEQRPALFVTRGYFEVMGVDLAMGRSFTADEEIGPGRNQVAVLSHRVWVDRFAADPDVLGRTVRLNRDSYTVVGVAPESYRGHQFGIDPAFYLPITQYRPARADPERFFGSRSTNWGSVLARLRPNTDVDELNAALATIFARLAAEHPESNRDRSARAARAGMAPAGARGLMAVTFLLISFLTLLVLVATCANVAGMLLARASARELEIAVRAALGSGRARLVRHLMTEALVVFGLGGAAGIYLATRILRIDPNVHLPVPLPVEVGFVMDWRLGAFGVLLTLLTGAVFGLLPALQATRHELASKLRDAAGSGGLRTSRLRSAFVAGQVAISVLLLATSGLFVRSLLRMSDLTAGFDTERVYVTSFDLTLEGYDDADRGVVFVDRLLETVRAMPDVAGATVASDIPLDGGSSSTPVWPDGRGADEDGWIQSNFSRISDGYFEALGVEMLQGRTLGERDGAHTEPVAVINRTFAARAWPDGGALGRTVELGLESRRYTVVGVVADTKADMITDRQSPQVFTYLPQDFDPDLHLAVRQRGAEDDFVPRMRRTVLSVDAQLGLTFTRPLDDLAELGLLPHRLMAGIGSSLGLLALLLSGLGLYGVVAFTVTRKTREIGVRIALGAERRDVLARVLMSGLVTALPGIAVGTALALAMGQVVQGILSFSALDPLTYLGVAVILFAVIVAACSVPAWRAASLHPVEALRFD